MNIEIRRAERGELPVVRNLMELYQYDFSELDGTDLDDHGQYGYDDLERFWDTPLWSVYIMKVDGKWAGFTLTNDEVLTAGNTLAVVEFFVVRKYRRLGLGRRAAREIMTRFPAKWEIRVIKENPAALNFWQTLLSTTWPDRYRFEVSDNEAWCGPILSVDTSVVKPSQIS